MRNFSPKKNVSAPSLVLGSSRRSCDPQHLLAVVPLVDRLRLVEPLVALEAHERARQGGGGRARELGFADSGRPLDEEWAAELEREKEGKRGLVAREVARLLERGRELSRFGGKIHVVPVFYYGKMSDRDDLLRVDVTGTVHPVGRAASQELRSRAGEWRLVPSTPGVVVMRRPEQHGIVAPSLRLAGEIKTPGALCDIISLVAQSNWKGELVIIEERKVRSLYFDAGNCIAAHTNVPEERLGETLFRFGVVTREQLEKAVAASNSSGKRFGETAIDLDFVTPEELYPMMARQVEEVFYAALHVGDGMFYFFDRYDESAIGRRHNLNASMMLMEGARRMDEMKFFRERIPNENYIPVPRETSKKVPNELATVYKECDGKRSIAQIGRRIGNLEFEVTKAVFQLVSGGFLIVQAPRPQGPQAIMEGFNPALSEIHQRCDASGKGAELRDGLARFATGGGVYDPAVSGRGTAPGWFISPRPRRTQPRRARGGGPGRVAHPTDARLHRFRFVSGRIALASRRRVAIDAVGGGALEAPPANRFEPTFAPPLIGLDPGDGPGRRRRRAPSHTTTTSTSTTNTRQSQRRDPR